ncbi:MAG: helix-turn-helix domain-containing protein [Collimonas sp.]|uniref:winged helix-turn-helix transcriptional regulator n=1 Tax=Collimonas sp. TaxID=1963772 RepID=UPI0032631638
MNDRNMQVTTLPATLPAARGRGRPGAREDLPCPIRDVLDRIGDAWSVLVLTTLEPGPARFNQLRRQVGGISQRMLTVTLRHLERDGLVSRTVIPSTPPQVEYALTGLGRSLCMPLKVLADWACSHQTVIRGARRQYDMADS